MNRGKFVISAMVAVGLAMAIFAWWARYSASQRILQRFGPSVAVAVRNGDRVELLNLETTPPRETTPPSDSPASIKVPLPDGIHELYITKSRDITHAAGLIHARHHLLHEKGFEWQQPDATESKNADRSWSVALRFTDDSNVATWLFDFEHQQAYIVERNTEIGMAPIASSLRKFIDGL